MSGFEDDLPSELRLMAYLDRQLSAEAARKLEGELAADSKLAAELAALRRDMDRVAGQLHGFAAEIEAREAPDWQASLAGAQAKFAAAAGGEDGGAQGREREEGSGNATAAQP
ncbi:MAG: hypothetical protein ACREP2_12945, partial [Rhodanobacteraceae bacterium]